MKIRMPIRRLLLVLIIATYASGCRDGTGPDTPPDPGFAPTVQLVPPTAVGDSVFPVGNTARGGQGQPVDGVSCIETMAYHEHAHVSLFVQGRQVALPAGVGIVNPKRVQGGFMNGSGCLYALHTHDATGIIHIEPPTPDRLNLGQFFAVWGQPLSATNVAGFEGRVTIFVDGVRYRGDPGAISLADHQEITLQVGTPLAPLPRYTFPEGY